MRLLYCNYTKFPLVNSLHPDKENVNKNYTIRIVFHMSGQNFFPCVQGKILPPKCMNFNTCQIATKHCKLSTSLNYIYCYHILTWVIIPWLILPFVTLPWVTKSFHLVILPCFYPGQPYQVFISNKVYSPWVTLLGQIYPGQPYNG